jgi:hypothetical protein
MHNLSSIPHLISSSGKNKLTYIPPEIVYLRNLRQLNIAGNRLKYLPAEMLNMSLTQLHVHPNTSFLKDPYDKHSSTDKNTKQVIRPRSVSDTKHCLPRIISLVEMAFRVLFSPSSASQGEYLLEEYYDLPLDECPSSPFNVTSGKQQFPYPIPPHLRKILSTCVRYSVDPEEPSTSLDDPWSMVTGIGHCPSPRHRDPDRGQFNSGVFVRHAEERISWEPIIAGISVGGNAPVLWRGCQWGCLDYLDKDGGVGNSDGPELPEIYSVNLIQVGGVDSSSGEETEDAVQVIQLLGANGLDEFDDE